ncbi:DUF6600 domain-containing protein [Uliginosibacterium sediminicola]|uniref:DUF6600 domain-containing protein n=1 Tax=Uliginosibacterium sediminicola TaxID=2024550 RepID=A0ABU9YY00_9RHOO
MNNKALPIRLLALVLGLLSLLCLVNAAPAAEREDDSPPPARVARLGYIAGNVSFAPGDQDKWSAALLNRPLTAGDRLWVAPGGRAELHVGSTALRLAGGTALQILYLGDEDLKLKLSSGSLALRVRDYPDNEYIEVDTPNFGFTVKASGDYRFDVDNERNSTSLSLRRGRGAAYTEDTSRPSVQLAAGQRVRFEGQDLLMRESGGLGPRDDFDNWVAQRDARDDASPSARYVSRDMPGYQELDEYGDWSQFDGYGAVWLPRAVPVGWAPYHAGHWAWIEPWGWTWIDDAAWGFAPFHYGRWARFGERWGWVPGPVVRRPVYAPALVAFVGARNGSWSVSLSSGQPGIAWFALGPNEAYRPAYTRDTRYVERINPFIRLDRNPGSYINQRIPHAIAVMPERDFLRGVPARPGVQPALRERDFNQLPVQERLPLRPSRDSLRGNAPQARELPPAQLFRLPVMNERSPAADQRQPAREQVQPRRAEPGFVAPRSNERAPRDEESPRTPERRAEPQRERAPAAAPISAPPPRVAPAPSAAPAPGFTPAIPQSERRVEIRQPEERRSVPRMESIREDRSNERLIERAPEQGVRRMQTQPDTPRTPAPAPGATPAPVAAPPAAPGAEQRGNARKPDERAPRPFN